MNKILIAILVIALIAGGVALGFMGSEWLSRGELEDVRSELNGQISALEAEIAEKNERIRTLESERNALSTEKGELEANLKALDEEKTELEAEKAELEDSLATLEEEKKALDDKAVELDASIKSLNDKVASLEASGDADEAEIAKLKGDIASLESEKSAVANKVTELEGDIANKSAEIEGLNSDIDGLEAEKADLNSQVSTLEAEIAEKDTEINGLSSSVSTLQGEKWALEDQILNLEEKNQALENEKNELEKENETLKNCLSGDHDFAGYEYRFSADMTTADKNAMCLNCKKAYETETVSTVYEKPKLTATFAGDDVKVWDLSDGVSLTAEELRAGVTYMLSKGDRELDITLPAEADIDKLIAIRRALIDTEDLDSGSVSLTLRGITEIPDYHFYDGSGDYGDGVFGLWYVDGMHDNAYTLGALTLTDVRYIGEYAFCECYYLSYFSAPLATEVGSDAFSNSLDNAEVYLPLVETVGDDAFEYSKLTEISLPSAKSIGNFSFNCCSYLSKIHLPSVTNIGMYAFQTCIALTQLTLGNLESVNHSDLGIFYGVSDTADIDLTVSCAQKALTLGGDDYWTPTDTLYTETDDYANGVFMGYTFKSVSIFHEIEYTVGDGVHTADCALCDYTVTENHAYDENGDCVCGDSVTPVDSYEELLAAVEQGGSIALTADIDLGFETPALEVKSDLTLNLNGRTVIGLSGIFKLTEGVTLTVLGEGRLELQSYGYCINATVGTANILGGVMEGDLTGNINVSGGQIGVLYSLGDCTVSGGQISSLDMIEGSCTVSGGQIDSLSVAQDSECYVSGGQINSNLSVYGNCVISGGSIASLSIFNGSCTVIGVQIDDETFYNVGGCTVTDGDTVIYTGEGSLQAAVAYFLEKGVTDITVDLPDDASYSLFTPIRRALVDTEGVADGSINLTISGARTIPDHIEHGEDNRAVFGELATDKNGEYLPEEEYVLELKSISLPDVEMIGSSAFRFCKNLTSLSAPKVVTVHDWAFAITALESLYLPEATKLAGVAFYGCESLTTIKLPKVTSLDYQALDTANLDSEHTIYLTAEEDILVHEDLFFGFVHYDILSTNVNLVLNSNKQSQVSGSTWTTKDKYGDEVSFTFKSVSFTDGEAE
ncbi:MAG: leucine-rich repeat protein [Clostridia bacterium]|nr:leucine-rich repeat protein [Clostridia bacterium]